jgi:uncharacterized membrane protein YdcZ (DUF606 family)
VKGKRVAPFAEYLAESTTACLITMVQGNVLALTLGHVVIASQTGVVAGLIAAITLAFAKTDRRWVVSAVLGVATAVVDYFVHPGMFGAVATEAIVTGLAAAVISYLVGTVLRYFRRKPVSTS